MSDSGGREIRDTTSLASALRDSVEGPTQESKERIRARVLADVRAGFLPVVARGAFARAAAVFAALSLGLGAVTFAAADSLPGSPLYPLKRAMEEVRVQLTPPSARSEALIELARERVREVRELMDSQAPDTAVDTAVDGFDDAAKRAVEQESDPARVRDHEREIEEAVSAESEPVQNRVEEGGGDSASPPAPDSPGEPGGNTAPGSDSGSDSGGDQSPGTGQQGSADGAGSGGTEDAPGPSGPKTP